MLQEESIVIEIEGAVLGIAVKRRLELVVHSVQVLDNGRKVVQAKITLCQHHIDIIARDDSIEWIQVANDLN